MSGDLTPARAAWRRTLHEVIFEADTPAGKRFDVVLLAVIVASIAAVMLESVASIRSSYGRLLLLGEWTFTALFSLEYLLRLACVDKPLRYARSFFGVIDLLAILPTFVSLFVPGAQSLLIVRALRLLRVFRVLKLGHFLYEASVLSTALRASLRKITVFLGAVLTIVMIVGAIMYLIEGEAAGFTSIPRAVYWAIVTMTTVGYGDIAPKTVSGQVLASLLMIMGYGIIAVPTGIVSVELSHAHAAGVSTQACPSCGGEGHERDARHCKHCGARL